MKGATVLIVIMMMVILWSIVGKPNAIVCAIAPTMAIFYLAFGRPHDCAGFESGEADDIPANYEATPDPALDICAEHAPADPWHPTDMPATISPSRLADIAKENACALNELYGRRSSGSIDDRLLVHKQRIGDRDRQATISQVRSRRNNVMEPYFRQELSERNSERWWEADNRIVRFGNKQWNDTVPMNRDLLEDENVDGIYGQL